MFQQYPQERVNEPILLHEGSFFVRLGDHYVDATGSARLRWLPSPHIVFDIAADSPINSGDLASMTVELADFKTTNCVVHSTDLISTISASAGAMESEGKQRLHSVGFQVVNFRDFNTLGPTVVPGDPTAVGGDSGTTQTLDLKHDGWVIRLVVVPESRDRYQELETTGGYAFTHVGHLKRSDDSTFSVEEAKDILESLRVFLSFARGAMCGLPIQWGRGVNGEIAWRRFMSPVADRWKRPYSSWIGTNHGTVLTELFDSFCRKHNDRDFREPLAVAVHMYSHCNTRSSGMEGSIILGTAALELLGTLIVVDQVGSMSAKEYDKLSAAGRLEELLSILNTETHIPHRVQALARFAGRTGCSNACGALAKLRNGFVHPKEKNRQVVFGPEGRAAAPDACSLSVWYQELALLHLLDHHGSYCNRTTAKWDWEVEPVPWSKP